MRSARWASVSSQRPLAACAVLAALLAGCAGQPPLDWQANARSALDRATAAYLRGESKVAAAEFDLARRELARTGRADLVAHGELVRCAAQLASLDVAPCDAFEALRPEARAEQRAYADYLAGRLAPTDIAQLPAQHRGAATAAAADAASALAKIDDPLARLVAAGALFRTGRASPSAIEAAVDTASIQGWRRPLLAWLGVQRTLAEKAGNAAEAERLRRRIALVAGER